MKNEFRNVEVRWRTFNRYVDVETGEMLEESQVKQEYTIIARKKSKYVYKSTGTITITNECRRSTQYKIW